MSPYRRPASSGPLNTGTVCIGVEPSWPTSAATRTPYDVPPAHPDCTDGARYSHFLALSPVSTRRGRVKMAGMTLVFVHGNPETSAIWGPLVAELGRDDVVLLSPPGFGAPLPDGFGATFLEYRDWLEDELTKVDGPIDLVGHDWGGGHVVNVVMHRPELVRSWASDVVGLFDPDYVWHDMAQAWQTPGVGEESLATMMGGGLAARTELMMSFGIPADISAAIAEHQNDDMAKAILALYRSAAQPAMAEAGRALENAQVRPGLALLATDDPFIGVSDNRLRAADRAGAHTAVLEGLGHWWMVEDPKRGADVLNRFWATLG